MTTLLLIVAWGLALLLLPWFGLMALVTAGALAGRLARARARGADPAATGATTFLFVVPAHDEEAVIDVTVRSCRAVDYDPARFQVCVIADNCTDATAEAARSAGAEVWGRADPARKSKGYALEDFFAALPGLPELRPADAFVLVDADTSVAPDLLRAFDRSLARGDDFIQGYYTVRNADASWRTRLMTFAFSLANGAWPAGLDRLGLGVGLKGNGMCFRAAALRRFPWRAAGLVEDMEFAWNLRVGGERVRFDPDARVFGEMVSRGGPGAASQRRRWESGRRALRGTFRRALGRSTHLSAIEKLLYRLDLEYPPLGRLAVRLAFATTLACAGGMIAAWSPGWVAVVAVLGACWACLLAYAACPVAVVGLPPRYLASVGHLPAYLVWKFCVGSRRAPQQWVRTPREAAAAGQSEGGEG